MNITHYLKEIKTEFSHVSWPTRTQTVVYTIAVIAICVLVGYLLGFFDFVFSNILETVLLK